jgi:hypothetical protein
MRNLIVGMILFILGALSSGLVFNQIDSFKPNHSSKDGLVTGLITKIQLYKMIDNQNFSDSLVVIRDLIEADFLFLSMYEKEELNEQDLQGMKMYEQFMAKHVDSKQPE